MQVCTRLAKKYRTQNSRQKSPSGQHRTTVSGYIFANKARIDNPRKSVKQQYVLHMSPQYGELRPTSGWDRSGNFEAPQQISTGFASWERYCTASISGRQPNCVNRKRHLCSAGRPSRWALARILVAYSSAVLYFSEPRAARFRPASQIRTKATPVVYIQSACDGWD